MCGRCAHRCPQPKRSGTCRWSRWPHSLSSLHVVPWSHQRRGDATCRAAHRRPRDKSRRRRQPCPQRAGRSLRRGQHRVRPTPTPATFAWALPWRRRRSQTCAPCHRGMRATRRAPLRSLQSRSPPIHQSAAPPAARAHRRPFATSALRRHVPQIRRRRRRSRRRSCHHRRSRRRAGACHAPSRCRLKGPPSARGSCRSSDPQHTRCHWPCQ